MRLRVHFARFRHGIQGLEFGCLEFCVDGYGVERLGLAVSCRVAGSIGQSRQRCTEFPWISRGPPNEVPLILGNPKLCPYIALAVPGNGGLAETCAAWLHVTVSESPRPLGEPRR